MTEATADPRARLVTGEWLTIERSTETTSEGVIATVDVSSAASTAVGVRVREVLPDSWAVTGVGVHPDFEPPEFTAESNRIEFIDVVYPDERRRFVYGVRVETADGLEPLADPVIVSERRLPDGDGDAAEPGRPDGPTASDPAGHAEAARDRRDEAVAGEPGRTQETGDDPVDVTDDDWTDLEDEPVAWADPPLFDEPGAPAADAGADTARVPTGDGPESPESGLQDPTSDPADVPAFEIGTGEAVTGGPVDVGGVRPGAAGPGGGLGIAGDGGLVEAPAEVLAGAGNLLVLAEHEETEAGCADLLDRQLDAGDGLVLVTFAESADDRLEVVRGLDGRPADFELLCMGDPPRSSAADPTPSQTSQGEVSVTSIADATDLFRLGVHVSRAIDEAPGEPVLCLHSLTALIGLVDLQRVFRFLHVLSGRVRAAGASAHFHLDPSVVDEQALRTLEHLFDDVVRFEDGEWMADSSARTPGPAPELEW